MRLCDEQLGRLGGKALERNAPAACTFELTHRCNFHCKMCYVRTPEPVARALGRHRTPEEWLDMACQARDAGVLQLTLTGGECLSYPGFAWLYENLMKMGFSLGIMTNAALMNDEFQALFSRLPPHRVDVSLYGASNATYEAITGDSTGFERVMRGIRRLKEIGLEPDFHVLLTKPNLMDYPKVCEIVEGMNGHGITAASLIANRNGARFSETDALRLSPGTVVGLESFSAKELECAIAVGKKLDMRLDGFQMPARDPTRPKMRKSCHASKMGSSIDWSGRMRTCVSQGGFWTEPFRDGFSEAWRALQCAVPILTMLPEACLACPLLDGCRNCMGQSLADGTLGYQPDPYGCKITYLRDVFRREREAFL